MAFWAVHGMNTFDSKVCSVGAPTVVFLTGLGMLLEIHTAEFLEGLAKVHSLGQLNLTEPGRQSQCSPRAPAGTAQPAATAGRAAGAQPGQSRPRQPGCAAPRVTDAPAQTQPLSFALLDLLPLETSWASLSNCKALKHMFR